MNIWQWAVVVAYFNTSLMVSFLAFCYSFDLKNFPLERINLTETKCWLCSMIAINKVKHTAGTRWQQVFLV